MTPAGGKVRIYVATSLDGFIADHEGGVDFLDHFDPKRYGYETFAGEVGAVIMGRRTYELVRALGVWPYRDKRAYVLSSRPLGEMPKGAVTVSGGVTAGLAAAREIGNKDIWVVGGAVTMRTALEARAVDLVEVFLVPVLLGQGLSLLGQLEKHEQLSFLGIETFADGVVKLSYKPEP
jgi:dihydrofolate reductase